MIPPIENISALGDEGLRARLRAFGDGQVIGQELVQKGAMHAVQFLLADPANILSNAKLMQRDLSRCAMIISEECARRGLPVIQT